MLRTMKRPTTPRSTLVRDSRILVSVMVMRMSTQSTGSVVRGAAVRAGPAVTAAAGTSETAETAITAASKRTFTWAPPRSNGRRLTGSTCTTVARSDRFTGPERNGARVMRAPSSIDLKAVLRDPQLALHPCGCVPGDGADEGPRALLQRDVQRAGLATLE